MTLPLSHGTFSGKGLLFNKTLHVSWRADVCKAWSKGLVPGMVIMVIPVLCSCLLLTLCYAITFPLAFPLKVLLLPLEGDLVSLTAEVFRLWCVLVKTIWKRESADPQHSHLEMLICCVWGGGWASLFFSGGLSTPAGPRSFSTAGLHLSMTDILDWRILQCQGLSSHV